MKRLPERKKTRRFIGLLSLLLIALLLLSAFAIGKREEEEAAPVFSSVGNTVKTLLILGKDRVGSNTDVMMLVRLDGVNDTAFVLQLPRDTYVSYQDKGVKLNSLYGRFKNEAKKDHDPAGSALTRLTAVLSEALGTGIDGYVLIGLDCFRDIVDAVGGVSVNVPVDLVYEDPEQGLHIDIKAGEQTLDGEKAEQFIRCRSAYVRADLGRVDAQKLFLSAFIARVQEGLNVKQLISVALTVIGNTSTSLAVSDIPGLASAAMGVPLSSVRMMTAPGATTQSGSYYILNGEGMKRILTDYFAAGSKFDREYFFRGYVSDEVRALYEKPYKEELILNGEEIRENGISIPARNS